MNVIYTYFKTRNGYIIQSIGIIIACAVIGYGHTLNYSFHFDDIGDIVDNPAIRNISAIHELWNYAPERFLAMVSFALNYSFQALDVTGYHIVNIIIHIITTLAVWTVTWLLLASPNVRHPQRKQIALFVALLFVCHPVQTQAVTYIVQRMASMAAMFYLLSLMFYAAGRQIHMSTMRQALVWTLSFLFGICAMFTKQISFTLPIAILLYEICFIQTDVRSFFQKRGYTILVPFFVLLIIIPALNSFKLGVLFRTIEAQQGHTVTLNGFNYLLTQFRVIVTYIRLIFFPVNQNLDYDYPIFQTIANPNVILSFIFLASLIFWALHNWKQYRVAAFGVIWFFLTLAVESSIIPIPNVIFEHRMYLPSFGLLLAGTYMLFQLKSAQLSRYAPLILSAILIVLLMATHQRNTIWENEWTLWNDVVQKSPNNARPWNNRGKFLLDQQNYKAAIQDFNKSIRINPSYFQPRYNRGVALQKLGYLNEAMDEFNRLIVEFPNSYEVYNSRGCIYLVNHKFDKALHDLNHALTLRPDFINALNNRAVLYLQTGNTTPAMLDFKTILTLDPYNPEALINSSLAQLQQHNYDEAIRNFSNYLSHHPGIVDVYFNRGKAYFKSNHYKHALDDFNSALRLAPKQAQLWQFRGLAHWKLNLLQNALNDLNKALSLDKQLSDVYYYLALINGKLGRVDEALHNLDILLSQNPEHRQAIAQQKKLLASRLEKN